MVHAADDAETRGEAGFPVRPEAIPQLAGELDERLHSNVRRYQKTADAIQRSISLGMAFRTFVEAEWF